MLLMLLLIFRMAMVDYMILPLTQTGLLTAEIGIFDFVWMLPMMTVMRWPV